MLDEATSALDVANENQLYQQLATTATTPVSVAHRSSILRYHPRVLALDADGGWQCHAAEHYSFDQ